ncbi:MAG: hypothetical protein QM811_19580 [Pirellulales bacterium]
MRSAASWDGAGWAWSTALQVSTNRQVALKVVRNEVLETVSAENRESTLARFRHKAQAAAQLEHDNIVTVFEVNEVRGLRYYAMRYVTGKSLIDFLRDGPLENRRTAAYIEPIAQQACSMRTTRGFCIAI